MNEWENAFKSRVKKVTYKDFDNFARVLATKEYEPDMVILPDSLQILAVQLGNCLFNVVERN